MSAGVTADDMAAAVLVVADVAEDTDGARALLGSAGLLEVTAARAAVDRTHRISSAAFSTANPGRWHVLREAPGESVVYRGLRAVLATGNHAGAIAYADLMAREEASR